MNQPHEATIAMLLSLESFEGFYGGVMRLNRETYLRTYRNDFSFMYAYALAEQGVHVVIYLPSFGAGSIHPIDPGISIRFLHIRQWYSLWRRFPFLTKTPYGRYVAQLANTLAFQSSLVAALQADQIDLLYLQEYWTARFDHLVRKLDLPVIAADHGGRQSRQLAFRKSSSFPRAAAITCQTENECDAVRAFGTEPVLLPNGIDTAFFDSADPANRHAETILIVARLNDSQKRVSDLIRSLQHLPPAWRLQIAGTGPDESQLRSLANDLRLEHRVKFLGFVSGKPQLRELYRQCGVYAMPSAVEGIPLAILEAMSCECACVVSDIRAFAMIEDGINGCKAPVGRPHELATAIQRAYANRHILGNNARQTVEKTFSLRTMTSRLKQEILCAKHSMKNKHALMTPSSTLPLKAKDYSESP